MEPVLTRDIPATAWTPSLDECLETRERYVWSIRAITEEGPSKWASPLFFEPATAPVPDDLATALEIVRRHLPSLQGSQPEAPLLRELDGGTPDPEGPEVIVGAIDNVTSLTHSTLGPEAKLTVTGEVRTLDPEGEPRLWGRGRGGINVYPKQGSTAFCTNVFKGFQYGLTRISVDWGSAADACPAGTWVCSTEEVGTCDTSRPDGAQDALGCAGESDDFPADAHLGWTKKGWSDVLGLAAAEDGSQSTVQTCRSLPVWCCWPSGGASSADAVDAREQ